MTKYESVQTAYACSTVDKSSSPKGHVHESMMVLGFSAARACVYVCMCLCACPGTRLDHSKYSGK